MSTPGWLDRLRGNPLPWLLSDGAPPVRHLALQWLLDAPGDAPEVVAARRQATASPPIANILAAQDVTGFWEKPGPGYATKYRGTVWQVIFLDQLGADPDDPRIRTAAAYVLAHTLAPGAGFGASGVVTEVPPPASRVLHCLNGNLLRALVGFGWLEHPGVQQALEWEAHAITGEPPIRFYASGTPAPEFCCVANAGRPCAWGAIKALLALARVPVAARSPLVTRAICEGTAFLLSRDPRLADYPTADGRPPSTSWFKLGFPSGYVADVLQNLEVLCELGFAADRRMQPAVEWLLSKQDAHGRWINEHAYNRKTWIDFDRRAAPSKWVTLRVCRVLKLASG